MFAPESAMSSSSAKYNMPIFSMPMESNPFAPGYCSASDSEEETSERSTNDNPDAYDQWQRWANKNQRQQRRKFFRRKSQKHNLLDDDVDDAVERFMKMSSNSCRSSAASRPHALLKSSSLYD